MRGLIAGTIVLITVLSLWWTTRKARALVRPLAGRFGTMRRCRSRAGCWRPTIRSRRRRKSCTAIHSNGAYASLRHLA